MKSSYSSSNYPFCNQITLCFVLLATIALPPLSADAQRVKKNPDGTVEVYDEESSPAPKPASSSYSSVKKSHAGGASGAVHKQSSGKIPAYTKKGNGVTVSRHADGTVDVYDSSETAPQGKSSAASSRAETRYAAGQAVTRHSDGRVDVYDSTMSSPPSSSGSSGNKIGAYKKNYGDVSVKRNANGTVDVVDTSSTTIRKSK